MGIFRELASGFTLGLVPDDATMEERKRLKCEFEFSKDTISEEEFQSCILKVAKSIQRISNIEFGRETVRFTVKTSSGIGEWHFILDFNDYGSFTGNSWLIDSENNASEIPKVLQERLYDEFDSYLKAN